MNKAVTKSIIILAAVFLLVTGCTRKSASLEIKTIEVDEFLKHPQATNEAQGLHCVIRFTYPSHHNDPAVLNTLQRRFIALVFGEKYASLTPEEAVKTCIAEWKKEYDELSKEFPSVGEYIRTDSILFVNDHLLQIREYSFTQLGGAHGFDGESYCLFNLQTGKEYSRDEIFKPEAASLIMWLINKNIRQIQGDDREMYWPVLANEMLTENTGFAITREGLILQFDTNLRYKWLEKLEKTISHAYLYPYMLREGTPVWDLSKEMSAGLTNETHKAAVQKTVAEWTKDEQQTALLMEIYYKLPESVMPLYLKTATQRREADLSVGKWHIINCLSHHHLVGSEGSYEDWNMAAYYTADERNIVLIVQYGSGFDGYELGSDKTLNYNIESGALTEIERPIDLYTVDELIVEKRFDTPELAAKAKDFFISNGQPLGYTEFDKNGFMVKANLFGYDDDDYYGEQNNVWAKYRWNGSRFEKSGRQYYNLQLDEVILL